MLPVSKYVNMKNPTFVGKDDVELWEELPESMRAMVVAEYIGDRVEQAVFDFGRKVGEVAMALKETPITQSPSVLQGNHKSKDFVLPPEKPDLHGGVLKGITAKKKKSKVTPLPKQ